MLGRGFLYLQGWWKKSNEVINLINVYSPCSLIEKINLWEELIQLKRCVGDGMGCVLGDFSVVRKK